MKIVLSFDSFKGSKTALEVCTLVKSALQEAVPSCQIVIKPMADGGEGTAQAMIAALDGKWIPARVIGPLPTISVDAGFAWFESRREALVEMASASGLPHLRREQKNPLITTTYGTGQLIKQAFRKGCRHLSLAVGGSATVDGGVGAAMALGWQFLDAQGKPIGFGGGELELIRKIVPPPSQQLPPVEVLCDVENPLCGKNGAAFIFGPQKGATHEMVKRLDAGLHNLGQLVQEQLGIKIIDMPGAGAAGGLAGGAVAFLGARLVSGIQTIMRISELEKEIADADWVITGEGCFDDTSLHGKVVSGIIQLAKKTQTKVAVIAGSVNVPREIYEASGITTALSVCEPGMTTPEAIKRTPELLKKRTQEFVRDIDVKGMD